MVHFPHEGKKLMENNNMMEFLKSSPTRTQKMEMSEWEREPKKCTQFPLQMCGVFHKFVLKIKYTLSVFFVEKNTAT